MIVLYVDTTDDTLEVMGDL